MTKIRNI